MVLPVAIEALGALPMGWGLGCCCEIVAPPLPSRAAAREVLILKALSAYDPAAAIVASSAGCVRRTCLLTWDSWIRASGRAGWQRQRSGYRAVHGNCWGRWAPLRLVGIARAGHTVRPEPG